MHITIILLKNFEEFYHIIYFILKRQSKPNKEEKSNN